MCFDISQSEYDDGTACILHGGAHTFIFKTKPMWANKVHYVEAYPEERKKILSNADYLKVNEEDSEALFIVSFPIPYNKDQKALEDPPDYILDISQLLDTIPESVLLSFFGTYVSVIIGGELGTAVRHDYDW